MANFYLFSNLQTAASHYSFSLVIYLFSGSGEQMFIMKISIHGEEMFIEIRLGRSWLKAWSSSFARM